MSGLLSHDHPDLNRSSIVLLIKVDGLVGAGCDLIRGGMSALMLDTCWSHGPLSDSAFPACAWILFCLLAENNTNLPHVEDVLLPTRSLVRVQHHIAVASVKLPVHAGTDFSQFQVLDTPHLRRQIATAWSYVTLQEVMGLLKF